MSGENTEGFLTEVFEEVSWKILCDCVMYILERVRTRKKERKPGERLLASVWSEVWKPFRHLSTDLQPKYQIVFP